MGPSDQAIPPMKTTLEALSPRLARGFGQKIGVGWSPLPNGVLVIASTCDSSPLASVQVHLRAGNRDVPQDRTGLAHCVEHMMFKIPGLSLDETIEDLGGSSNAYTTFDSTCYWSDAFSTAVPELLALEARRFSHPGVDPKDLASEIDVILEERLQTVDNSPLGRVSEEIYSRSFDGHPYAWPILGHPADLERTEASDCLSYIQTQYAAPRLVLVLSSPLPFERVLELAGNTLGSLPTSSESPPPRFDRRAAPSRYSETSVNGPAELSSVSLATVLTSPSQPAGVRECAAAELLAVLLAWGESSRLVELLIHEKNLAYDVTASLEEYELGSLFLIEARAPDRRDPRELRDAILSCLDEIGSEPISENELGRARDVLATESLRTFKTHSSRAEFLGGLQLLYGDLHRGFAAAEAFWDIRVEEISEVAKKIADRSRNVTVLLQA